MPRTHRTRRILKWLGTIACGLVLLAAAACLAWRDLRIHVHHWRGPGHHAQMTLRGGAVILGYWGAPPNANGQNSFGVSAEVERALTWFQLSDEWLSLGLFPKFNFSGGEGFVTLPLWIVLCVAAIPTALLWRLDRRRAKPGCCTKCGYNLTGNTTGRCPECGAASGA